MKIQVNVAQFVLLFPQIFCGLPAMFLQHQRWQHFHHLVLKQIYVWVLIILTQSVYEELWQDVDLFPK